MTIGYREGVAIGLLVVYVPALAIALFLAVKHGFGRSAGWFFLVILCLARIIGGSMQIAIASDPTNISLYTSSAILTNVGFSPLMLATLGLLSRLIDSINRSKKTLVTSQVPKLIELLIVVATILGIVGGINAGNNFQSTGKFTPGTLNHAGTALLIVAFVCILIITSILSFDIPHAAQGDHRIFYAILASLPFMIVRLVYSCFSSLTRNKNFLLINGNETIVLCMALVMELAVVVIYEVVGLTLKKVPQGPAPISSRDPSEPMAHGQYQQPKKENTALKIFKYTIFGRIIFALIPDKNQNARNDEEMQSQQVFRK